MKKLAILTLLLLVGGIHTAQAMTKSDCHINGGAWMHVEGWGWGCKMQAKKTIARESDGLLFDFENGKIGKQHASSSDIKEKPQGNGSTNLTIFDRWGNLKTKKDCETGGGVWAGEDGKGSCTPGLRK